MIKYAFLVENRQFTSQICRVAELQSPGVGDYSYPVDSERHRSLCVASTLSQQVNKVLQLTTDRLILAT